MFSSKNSQDLFFSEAYGNFMVTGRYSRLLRSGTDEMTHFHTKRNRRRRALETDALESTPAGVYGGGCSLDDLLKD